MENPEMASEINSVQTTVATRSLNLNVTLWNSVCHDYDRTDIINILAVGRYNFYFSSNFDYLVFFKHFQFSIFPRIIKILAVGRYNFYFSSNFDDLVFLKHFPWIEFYLE